MCYYDAPRCWGDYSKEEKEYYVKMLHGSKCSCSFCKGYSSSIINKPEPEKFSGGSEDEEK